MPDITMCANKTCPNRKNCYRFMAIPDKYQSYSGFIPKLDKNKKWIDCDYFDMVRMTDKIRPEK